MFENIKNGVSQRKLRVRAEKDKIQQAYNRGVSVGYRQAKERREERNKETTALRRVSWSGGHRVGKVTYRAERLSDRVNNRINRILGR